MRKKIVLISLPAPFASEPAMNPPLGLTYIASFLKKNNLNDISVLDFTLYKNYDYFNSEDYLKKIPLDGNFYGIYCMAVQFLWLIKVSRYIKTHTDAIVVAGGPHASTCPEECLRVCNVDIAVRGEGEEAFYEIVSGKEISKITGVCYLTKDKEFKENGRAFIKNLDELPFPDRELFNIRDYKRTIYGEKAVHLVTLRGCPYSCAFCDKVSVGTNVRYRTIANVLSEIDSVIAEYGYRSFVIYDDIFTLDRKRVYTFCKEFKKRRLNWRCWSRTNMIDKELLKAMRDSGLSSITFGVESGDDNVLRRIKKGATFKQNKEALLACKELKIPVRCSVMYGNPGENRASVENTIKLIAQTQPDEWNLAILAPIPGSDIWNNPEKFGVIFDKDWVRKNNYTVINRFDKSGIGSIWISLNGQSKDEFVNNLKFLVAELERVCPRKKIQDTIQDIDIDKLNILY
jgi:radical SAM superfamily enzyme YgiQ (UPF0313 family)